MATGSCLCGAIRFEFDNSDIVVSLACFCSYCRKVAGSQYGVYLQVRPKSFRWLSGEDNTGQYESSPGNKRAFCRTCGCVAPILNSSYGAVRVPGGALDEDPGVAPDTLLCTAGQAAWCTADAAQQAFPDTGPPQYWAEVVRKLYGG